MPNVGFYGPSATDNLESAIKRCLNEWGDDPAYADTAQKLREVTRNLDVLEQSPGARQAARLAAPNSAGQEPV